MRLFPFKELFCDIT